MKYDYLENMKEDIREYLKENDIEEISEDLFDTLWVEDSVTGNASGSYYCNSYKAQQALQGNEDLVEEMISEYCVDMNEHCNDYEYLDVSVRCYLLGQALEELKEEYDR